MKNYFDRTSLKFLLAFVLVIIVSLFVLGTANKKADEKRAQVDMASSGINK